MMQIIVIQIVFEIAIMKLAEEDRMSGQIVEEDDSSELIFLLS